jgi:hypothetical protein
LVQQAREAHRQALAHSGLSHQYRSQRDQLIRRIHAEGGCSYSSLASQIGCSTELIAKAVQNR